ncbi:MAG: ABC transporter substrate-binding protein [Promethearchaeota archaeon]
MSSEIKSPKERIPKKGKLFIKKQFWVGGIIVAIAIAGILGGNFLINIEMEEREQVFIYGTQRGILVLDPLLAHEAVHEESLYILENIAESLFDYEITAQGSSIVSNLALSGVWSDDGLNFTCTLRKGVKFHDDTPFNATAVKWNFDRLYRLRNEINYWLWTHPDGTPIINFNKTTVLDEYTIRFILNRPFVPLKALLGRLPLIVSPKSTPLNNFTYFNTGNLIGTGPFRHESTIREYDPYQKDVEKHIEPYYNLNTTLVANRDYWGGKPKLDKVIIKSFRNDTRREDAIMSGDIHYTPSKDDRRNIVLNIDRLNNTPGITLTQIIDKTRTYAELDTNAINSTMRKAISYALDYTELGRLDTMVSGKKIVQAKSPLPFGMLYANWTFDVPFYDVEKARKALKDANWPGTENLIVDNNTNPGNEWETLVEGGNPLAIYNFGCVFDEQHQINFGNVFRNNLTQIGVKIDILFITKNELIQSYWSTLDNSSHFWLISWLPDYNDPNDIIFPCYSNTVIWNIWRDFKSDAQLQEWIEEAVEEINPVIREQLYDKIQKHLIEELYFELLGLYFFIANPHTSNLRGINQYNNWKLLKFKDWYFS